MSLSEPVAGPGTPLRQALDEARGLGFLGPGPVDVHLRHAEGFAASLSQTVPAPPESLLDLGSGGGVPGLVLAQLWPECPVVLVEASTRRAEFLDRMVLLCGFGRRVVIDHRRAELAGRDPSRRHQFDLVTARSFGRPGVTAECGAPFLRRGGHLIVSEPPDPGEGGRRWPTDKVAGFGLIDAGAYRSEFSYRVLRQDALCPERFPRRDGVPEKRPLF